MTEEMRHPEPPAASPQPLAARGSLPDAVPPAGAGRDLTLSAAAAARVAGGLAANTRRAYSADWTAFENWCADHGRTALPASAATLAEYVTHLAAAPTRHGTPPAPATIDRVLGCVQSRHRLAGLICDARVARMALRDYRRERAAAGARVRKAPPIDVPTLRRLVDATDPGTLVGRRDRLILVLGFAMMGRRSEVAALDIGDLMMTADGLQVTVRLSKTDRDALGATVAIPYGSHRDTCPVRLTQSWLAVLAEHGVTAGPLLRAIDRHGRFAGSEGYAGRARGPRMSGDGLNRIVRRAAERAGLPAAQTYTFHGLRAGGATSAARAGAPVSAIQAHGRWAEGSPVVHGYIRAGDQWRDNPMRGVGL